MGVSDMRVSETTDPDIASLIRATPLPRPSRIVLIMQAEDVSFAVFSLKPSSCVLRICGLYRDALTWT